MCAAPANETAASMLAQGSTAPSAAATGIAASLGAAHNAPAANDAARGAAGDAATAGPTGRLIRTRRPPAWLQEDVWILQRNGSDQVASRGAADRQRRNNSAEGTKASTKQAVKASRTPRVKRVRSCDLNISSSQLLPSAHEAADAGSAAGAAGEPPAKKVRRDVAQCPAVQHEAEPEQRVAETEQHQQHEAELEQHEPEPEPEPELGAEPEPEPEPKAEPDVSLSGWIVQHEQHASESEPCSTVSLSNWMVQQEQQEHYEEGEVTSKPAPEAAATAEGQADDAVAGWESNGEDMLDAVDMLLLFSSMADKADRAPFPGTGKPPLWR